MNPNPWMSHRHYREPLAGRLLQMTPRTIAYIWTDGQLYTSHQDQRRPFAAAFRSIPDGVYRTLRGNGLDRNITVREQVRAGRRCLYVVNPAWWTARAAIKFEPAATGILDRVSGVLLPVAAGRLELALEAYGIRVLECPAAMAPVSATTKIDAEGREWCGGIRVLLEYLERLGAPEICAQFGLPDGAAGLLEQVKVLNGALAAEEYSAVLAMSQHPWMVTLLNYLRERQRLESAGRLPEPSPEYRVNLGSDQPYRDSAGREWLPDQFYQYGLNAYGYIGDGGMTIHRGNVGVANTADPEIYRTERFNFRGYRFKVPDGRYTVKLHYAEGWQFSTGERLTDLDIQGQPVLRDFDFNAAAGGFRTAYVKDIPGIEVTNGELALDMPNPPGFKIQGFEIVRQ